VSRLGVTLPQFTDDPQRLLSAASRAEAAGLDSVWVFDHLWPLTGGRERPILEAWTALAWLAATTSRIGIGTFVTRASLRRPALLAKMAATVALVAPGRVTVGVGSGDERSRAENRAFGIPYHAGRRRRAQLEETLTVLRRHLWGSGDAGGGSFPGLASLPPSPRPSPPPPVWVGGCGWKAVEVAGRLGDGWNGWGLAPEEFAARVARLQEVAADRSVEPTWGGLAILASSDEEARARAARRRAPESYVVGSPHTLARRLRSWVDAGARHLVLTFPNPSQPGLLEAVGERVRPALDRE
jgi:alkanesulfonate monooxygenase SsuD/methylene tetrahydromethanopterin reductase-like flavin-dependent oxidoreductase (luciferase family)